MEDPVAGTHRVVIADDHPVVRAGVKAFLEREEDLQVVGEASDGREAIRLATELAPDLVILDLSMPRTDGLEALREIKIASPATRVVVMTLHQTEEYVQTALKAGADGYVLKESGLLELAAAAHCVLAGRRYLCPEIATKVVAGYLEGFDRQERSQPFGAITERERQVLKLIAEGLRNREIADYLCVSSRTVEKHRASLMKKLQLKSVAALTTYAMDKGFLCH